MAGTTQQAAQDDAIIKPGASVGEPAILEGAGAGSSQVVRVPDTPNCGQTGNKARTRSRPRPTVTPSGGVTRQQGKNSLCPPFTSSGWALLFHLLSKLYEKASAAITTNPGSGTRLACLVVARSQRPQSCTPKARDNTTREDGRTRRAIKHCYRMNIWDPTSGSSQGRLSAHRH